VTAKKEKKVTMWFIEPLNAATNENATRHLAGLCKATDDKIYRDKVDDKGKKHDVVEVEYSFITLMERSVLNFHHRFRVFKQTEGESRMSLWIFGKQSNLSRTKEVRRAKKKIKKLSKRSTKKS